MAMSPQAVRCSVADIHPRRFVHVTGVITSVTVRSWEHHPRLRARLCDDSGCVDLVFLGRRAVPGIEPGRKLTVRAMVAAGSDLPVIYNPDYELWPYPEVLNL